jgi:ABC-type uncharacterized transport system auxiliary subunit
VKRAAALAALGLTGALALGACTHTHVVHTHHVVVHQPVVVHPGPAHTHVVIVRPRPAKKVIIIHHH